jgi:hypothetical protein
MQKSLSGDFEEEEGRVTDLRGNSIYCEAGGDTRNFVLVVLKLRVVSPDN